MSDLVEITFNFNRCEKIHNETAKSVGIGLALKLFDDFWEESDFGKSEDILNKGLFIAANHAESILFLPCYNLPKERLDFFKEVCSNACKGEWERLVKLHKKEVALS